MWRRPVGRAGSGPPGHKAYRIQLSDYDLHDLPGCRVVDGRQLSQEFLDAMRVSQENAPPAVNFVQQMRERKLNGSTEGHPSADRTGPAPSEPPKGGGPK